MRGKGKVVHYLQVQEKYIPACKREPFVADCDFVFDRFDFWVELFGERGAFPKFEVAGSKVKSV